MDTETQNQTNPIVSENTPDTTEENTKPETNESAEQSNVIDVIGNGQLIKKVRPQKEKQWTKRYKYRNIRQCD